MNENFDLMIQRGEPSTSQIINSRCIFIIRGESLETDHFVLNILRLLLGLTENLEKHEKLVIRLQKERKREKQNAEFLISQ